MSSRTQSLPKLNTKRTVRKPCCVSIPPHRTNNVVLSGIFVDCYQPVGGEVAATDPSKMLIPMTILATITLVPILAFVCIKKWRTKERPIAT